MYLSCAAFSMLLDSTTIKLMKWSPQKTENLFHPPLQVVYWFLKPGGKIAQCQVCYSNGSFLDAINWSWWHTWLIAFNNQQWRTFRMVLWISSKGMQVTHTTGGMTISSIILRLSYELIVISTNGVDQYRWLLPGWTGRQPPRLSSNPSTHIKNMLSKLLEK